MSRPEMAQPRSLRAVQRLEAYAVAPPVIAGGDGAVPGAVVGHGEDPRDAAVRAWAGVGIDVVAGQVVAVRCETVPDDDASGAVHVLKLIYHGEVPGAKGVSPGEPSAAFAVGSALAPAIPVPPGVHRRHPDATELTARFQRPGAYAVLVRNEHLLLTRLANWGSWTLPGGGIEHGEHPDDAVRREVLEEAGLPLTGEQLIDVDNLHYFGRNPAGVQEDFHGVRLIYRGVVPDHVEPVVLEVGGSTDAAAWVRLDRLSEYRTTELVGRVLRYT